MMMEPSSHVSQWPEHHLHELVGLVVAQVVGQVLLAAHVLGLAVVDGGHHVPGRAPVRHQVERGEAAGHVEGLEVGGRAGRGEAQLARHRAHGHEHDERVHLGGANAVLDRVRVIAAVAVGHGQAVVEEGHVELAGLQDARNLLVVVGRMGVVARLRVTPGARQVRAVLRLQEADHRHLPCHALLLRDGVATTRRVRPFCPAGDRGQVALTGSDPMAPPSFRSSSVAKP